MINEENANTPVIWETDKVELELLSCPLCASILEKLKAMDWRNLEPLQQDINYNRLVIEEAEKV